MTVSPAVIIAGVTSVTVSGQNFTPNKQVTVTYISPSGVKRTWTSSVGCNGAFSSSFTPGVGDIGSARVTASDGTQGG
ncbi:MAG: hypothetical protein E6J40_11160 [Chloroflexi bacterium]|nr:MAG: hypothetical protein E6J40_11160 [Chloroflexota bacterium]